jgi:hypothetical protein
MISGIFDGTVAPKFCGRQVSGPQRQNGSLERGWFQLPQKQWPARNFFLSACKSKIKTDTINFIAF